MSSLPKPDRLNFGPYCGYHQNWLGGHNEILVHTDPHTLCGEFLRRYWHPIYLADDVGDRPKLIKVLGEELVLFKDHSGQFGLVHKKCPHRRASMEYGRSESRGIRCCYHGWVFDVDGTILDIPGEPQDSENVIQVKKQLRLGAYPLREYKGLLFAYLGPPESIPPFPVYDAFEMDGITMAPYKVHFNCNWIQVLDAIVDPVHTAFLHQSQFSDGFGKMGEIQFYYKEKIRFLGTNTRRVGDNIWVRVNELILPNFTQAGAAFACDGKEERLFGRSAFTRWVVPIDDENCVAYAWANFGERGDPHEYNNREGYEMIEQGEIVDRPYDERQISPGDVEAVEGMGAISDHEKECFVPGDRGVGMYRNRIRKYCKDLEKGIAPPQPTDLSADVIPTFGSDTVLHIPHHESRNDAEILRQTNDQVMDILFSNNTDAGPIREQKIIDEIKSIN
ncbi:MAG: aromatic ring-hydroxylating dioxygenase subunit alpha [Pseudomonadota bacterium]